MILKTLNVMVFKILMKKGTVLTMIFLSGVSCKNKSIGYLYSKPTKVEDVQIVILPNHPLWRLNRLTLNNTHKDLSDNKETAFTLSRTSTTESAYASVNNIPVKLGNYYRASVLVKQYGLGTSFGLRIIGIYPNRVDAVFDLEKGLLKAVSEVGNFSEGEAEIEDMGKGWYKCSLTAKANADIIKIILGPSSDLNSVTTWESANKESSSVYIIPTSLSLKELIP